MGGLDVARVLVVIDALDLIVELANEAGVAWRAKAYPLRNGERVVLLERLGDVKEWEQE